MAFCVECGTGLGCKHTVWVAKFDATPRRHDRQVRDDAVAYLQARNWAKFSLGNDHLMAFTHTQGMQRVWAWVGLHEADISPAARGLCRPITTPERFYWRVSVRDFFTDFTRGDDMPSLIVHLDNLGLS